VTRRTRYQEPRYETMLTGQYMRCPKGHPHVQLTAVHEQGQRRLVASCILPGCGAQQVVRKEDLP
jgi:hypothetical protein